MYTRAFAKEMNSSTEHKMQIKKAFAQLQDINEIIDKIIMILVDVQTLYSLDQLFLYQILLTSLLIT